jgi:hypothetical protein
MRARKLILIRSVDAHRWRAAPASHAGPLCAPLQRPPPAPVAAAATATPRPARRRPRPRADQATIRPQWTDQRVRTRGLKEQLSSHKRLLEPLHAVGGDRDDRRRSASRIGYAHAAPGSPFTSTPSSPCWHSLAPSRTARSLRCRNGRRPTPSTCSHASVARYCRREPAPPQANSSTQQHRAGDATRRRHRNGKWLERHDVADGEVAGAGPA